MTDYTNLTDMASVFVDIHGQELSKKYRFSEFCKQVRRNPQTRHLCNKCDLSGGLETAKSGICRPYRCHAGLIDFATPVITEDTLYGFILTGQITTGDPHKIPAIMACHTALPTSDVKALYNKLPRYTIEEINSAARTLKILTDFYFPDAGKKPIQEILHQDTFAPATPVGLEATVSRPEIRKALKYIDANLTKDFNLRDVSQYVYLSEAYLSRLFKKETNYNLVQYVTEQRVQRAKLLLQDPALSIDNISKSVGYQQTNYFCRIFKRLTGESPDTYRRKLLVF